MAPHDYGNKYWVIGTYDSRGKIYLHAETVEVIDRCLVFRDGKDEIIFSMSDGCWMYFAAASVMDGHEVAVVSWENEEKAE